MLYDTFVSHASVNLAEAERLVQPMRARGLQVFFGTKSIPAGRDWANFVEQAVKSSTCLIVVLSPASSVNGNVEGEVAVAHANNVPILPVYIENFQLPMIGVMYPILRGIQWVTVGADPAKAVEEICAFIASHKPASPAAATPAPGTAADPSPSIGVQATAPPSGDETRKQPAPPVRTASPTHSPSAAANHSKRQPKEDARPALSREQLIERLRRDVDRGDRESAFLLGRLYASGIYVKTDLGMAVRYFRLAADGARGMPAAMYELGESYRLARGVGRHPEKAIEYHVRAAQADFGPSFYRLGRIYWLGVDAPQNPERAYRRFRAAAELEYAPAWFRLAEIHLIGVGAPKDIDKALKYAMRAAEQHDPAALNLVGRFYRRGLGVEADDAKACEWYERAMKQGSPEGAANLASMYRRGLGVDANPVRAIELDHVSRRLMHGESVADALGETSFRLEANDMDQSHGG